MAYKKTLWKDRVVEKPNTYRSVENPDGTITLYPITGQVIEKGTPVSAANLNKIENGIVELNEQLDNITPYKTEFINVILIGCDNTGVNDCTSILQEYIDNGYSLFFPEGKYKCNLIMKPQIAASTIIPVAIIVTSFPSDKTTPFPNLNS